MLLANLVDQFLHIPEILSRFPASPLVIITNPLFRMMDLAVVSLIVEDPLALPFVRVVDDRRLLFRVRLASNRRCIGGEH